MRHTLAALLGLLAVTGALAQSPVGSSCTQDVECRSGFCCTSTIFAQCPPPGNGVCAGCFADSDCGGLLTGQLCNTSAVPVPVCAEPIRDIGQSCTSSRQCRGLAYCAPGGAGGVCTVPSAVGATCTFDIQNQPVTCGADAYCLISSGASGTCVPNKGLGASCDGFTLCANWLQCDFIAPSPSTCKYLYGPNVPAVPPTGGCNNDDQCSDGYFCSTNSFGPGTCTQAIASGPCLRGTMCLSGFCTSQGICTAATACPCPAGSFCTSTGFCTRKFTAGSVCITGLSGPAANPAACASGICAPNTLPAVAPTANTSYCHECLPSNPNACPRFSVCDSSTGINVCLPLGINGVPCTSNGQCLSNNCVAGVCVNGCRTNADCATLGPNLICDQNDNLCKNNLPIGTPCLTDVQCGVGAVCNKYVCRVACSLPFNPVCPLGTTCDGKGCVPGTPSVKRPDGAHCAVESECASNICNCGICGFKCSCDADCSGQANTRCNLNTGKCEGPPGKLPVNFACIFSEQCASGYCNCGFCQDYCRSNYDCPLGYYCDSVSAQCLWNRKPNGARCLTNTECQSGYCYDCLFCAPGCSSVNPCPYGQYCNGASQCVPYTPLPCPDVCVHPNAPVPIQPFQTNTLALPTRSSLYGSIADSQKCTADSDCKSGICQLRTGYGLCGDCRVWPGLCLAGSTCSSFNGKCVAQGGTPGLVPDGGICAFDGQCRSGVCNYQTCGKCSATRPCLPGTTCDVTGKCTALIAPPTVNCPDGYSCLNDTQCASGVCNLGYCGWCFPPKNGYAGSCPSGWTCGANGKCIQPLISAGLPCLTDSQCQSGICTGMKVNNILQKVCQNRCLINADCPPAYACNSATGKCVFWLKPFGSVCRFDYECISGLCDGNFCGTYCKANECPLGTFCDPNTGKCANQKRADGRPCVYDNQCSSNVCNNGFCGSCSSPVFSGCPPGLTCGTNGKCVKALKPDGALCFLGSDCTSGFCIAGQCGLPCGNDPARTCPNGYYCSQGSCLPGCYYDNDCPAGNVCWKSVCRPRTGIFDGGYCSVDSECLSNWCYQGSCKSKGDWMERCGADIECLSGFCDVSFTSYGWGVCTLPCAGGAAATSSCPAGYFCGSGPLWANSMCVSQSLGFNARYAVAESAAAAADAEVAAAAFSE